MKSFVNGNVQVVYGVVPLISSVKCKFGCNVLKSVRMDWMSEWLGSKIRRMSSTYLKKSMILCLCDSRARCVFSVCCKKNYAIRPEEGAPIAGP